MKEPYDPYSILHKKEKPLSYTYPCITGFYAIQLFTIYVFHKFSQLKGNNSDTIMKIENNSAIAIYYLIQSERRCSIYNKNSVLHLCNCGTL